ncbi:DUF2281 domain-containing protein [Microcystis aeruginosa]|jgi:hypothetical protein|uniref:DUF2281 domain-containing protein n=1 Tax=Microcystis aeruginosa (strain NIES-843 / IAM M-2473) TaxID=449447 RepID=B0JXN2_MICAN|nr:DUF2281 domain-containing protein [Microcystis aeruginosa]BAG01859.1 hypothetical protein MAE_20370 [Microcystis aeruginosa NIES-843]
MNNAGLDTNSPLLQTLQTLPVQQQQEILDFLESIVNQHHQTQITPTGRIAGLYQGQGWISDDFNEPLTDQLLPPT